MKSSASRPSRVRAYLMATAVLAAALVLQWIFRPVVGHRVPFLFFFPALAIAAMWSGWRPALIVLAGGLINAMFWVEPVGRFEMQSRADLAVLAGFVIGGGVMLLIGARLNRMRVRAIEAEQILGTQVLDLEE